VVVEPVISLHDAKGRVVWANYAPAGATLEELIGSYPWDWVPEAEKNAVKARFFSCIALDESQRFSVIGDVHGRRVEINCRINPTSGPALPIIARTRVLDDRILLLTQRERQILQLVGQDIDAKVIARLLRLSRSAVDSYRYRAKAKLGIKSMTGLAIFAACNLEP
jgi:DNA-binding CsgD family transcriptional regulator